MIRHLTPSQSAWMQLWLLCGLFFSQFFNQGPTLGTRFCRKTVMLDTPFDCPLKSHGDLGSIGAVFSHNCGPIMCWSISTTLHWSPNCPLWFALTLTALSGLDAIVQM